MIKIDPRLCDAAMYDATVHAAISAIQHGADPVKVLTAAVLDLAAWRRAWSPEAMRAMLLAPPAPITICCVGKHDAGGEACPP